MPVPLFNRGLLAGMLAGAMVLTGACSRPDRAESGSNNRNTVVQDSSSSAVQPTTRGAVSKTSPVSADSGRSAATTKLPVKSNSPRAETSAPGERDAAGYRPMDRDTGNISDPVSDSARVTPDTSETEANAGSAEMARDTSTESDQADSEAGSNSSVVVSDTPDTAEMVRDRQAEDSTEIPGNVTSSDDLAYETADEQIVNPDDQDKVAASEAPKDEVGAAAVANGVTGAEVLMSREGVRCAVIDPQTNEAVRWDMSSTPVTLNPCGMGSMNLSKVWTAGQRGSWAAGQ